MKLIKIKLKSVKLSINDLVNYIKGHLYDDIVGINQKESYITAAEQFVKCCHPPIRLF